MRNRAAARRWLDKLPGSQANKESYDDDLNASGRLFGCGWGDRPALPRPSDRCGYYVEGGSGAGSEARWRRLSLSRTTMAGGVGGSPPLA